MGQRANYILIEKNEQVIHYNHWRANCITSDLYLGEKRFIEFVKSCKKVDVLLDEVWIEGCVIIDVAKKTLYFWSLEFSVTSATNFYLKELRDKWKDWSMNLLYNKMYDVEQILNIDYISKQEKILRPTCTIAEISDDEVDEWANRIIILKTESGTHVTQLSSISIDGILNFGENVISILLNRKKCDLPKEEDDSVFETIIIDTVNKEIIIDKSEFGLWEQSHNKWEGCSFKMGDFGYIGALKLANIDVERLVMSQEKIEAEFADLVKRSGDFDPVGLAKRLLQEEKDIKFSRYFFDNVKPKRTVVERIRRTIYKLIDDLKR